MIADSCRGKRTRPAAESSAPSRQSADAAPPALRCAARFCVVIRQRIHLTQLRRSGCSPSVILHRWSSFGSAVLAGWRVCVCPFHPDLGLSGTMRAPHIIFFQTFSLFAYLSGDRDRADPCNLYEGRPLSPLDVGPSSNCSACHIHSLSFLFAVCSDGDGRRISDLLTVDSELLSLSLCPLLLLLVVSHGEIALWHVRPSGVTDGNANAPG